MKKIYLVIPAALTLLAGIYAGSGGLPEGFEKNKVLRTSKAFLRRFNRQDDDGCQAMLSAELRETEGDRLSRIFASVKTGMGKFIRIKGVSITAKKTTEDDYAVCIVKCQYEHGEPSFAITLNKQMEICNLSIE